VSFSPLTFPRESCRIELHNVVVDGGAGCDELSPHRHEEPVEGVDWLFALDLDLAAVESSTELHLLIPMKPQTISAVFNVSVGASVELGRERHRDTRGNLEVKQNLSWEIC
jgi:hypothetical protein